MGLIRARRIGLQRHEDIGGRVFRVAADGIITFVLGMLVLAQWPASGLWVIGLFIGIDLIFYGAAWMALALGLRHDLR